MTLHVAHKRGLAIGLAAAVTLVVALSCNAMPAHAATLEELQQQVQESSQAYDEANGRVTDLQQQISDNQARIDALEAQLPGQRKKASDSIRTLYKMQQSTSGLIELVLSSENFNDFVAVVEYLDIIQSSNSDALTELAATQKELDSTRETLAQQLADAEAEAQAASAALDQAVAARTALEDQIAAQAAAEAAERQAAVEAAAAASADSSSSPTSFTTESGNSTPVETPSGGSVPPVDWQSNKDSFVAGWGARIDAYLAGSPLAGYGSTFAEAAWNYGVDPRFSPAISCVESSKGRYCFRPYNAWGWNGSSWSSWTEAIWAHTSGLASGYGGHLTYAAATKYCPPNADFWYSTVLAEMEKI